MQKSLRIFIAEDEGIILSGFKVAVERMGHKVIDFALDGNEALKKIEETQPDLVLMDINLPGMDGLTVVEKINRHFTIPFIIITGYYDDSLVEKATELGVFGYLLKPVNEKQLKATMDIAMLKSAEYGNLSKEADDLRKSLEERKYIEKAKGIIMDRFGLKESDAMKQLQRQSREKNKKLVVIAKEIIAAESLLD